MTRGGGGGVVQWLGPCTTRKSLAKAVSRSFNYFYGVNPPFLHVNWEMVATCPLVGFMSVTCA